MALVPCKVCGSLNSDQVDICLSCGYSTQGHKRPAIFQWAAFLVVAMLLLPLLLALGARLQRPTPPATPPKTADRSDLSNEEQSANRHSSSRQPVVP